MQLQLQLQPQSNRILYTIDESQLVGREVQRIHSSADIRPPNTGQVTVAEMGDEDDGVAVNIDEHVHTPDEVIEHIAKEYGITRLTTQEGRDA